MNVLLVRAEPDAPTIRREVYGHFAEHLGGCIYDGFWVGEDSPIPNTRGIRNDVVAALRRLQPPVLRWPGGCFADEYHWQDGIGPRAQRPPMLNTHWGMVTESNRFGTHEFLDLCAQIGAAPYICGNVGSGTVREMQQWVEYITYGGDSPMSALRRRNGRAEPWPLPYFGVGNENWACGGNMRAEYYADLYRRYQTYVRNLSGNVVFRIACGPNVADYNWTEVLMREAGPFMQGLALHYYTHPGGMAGSTNRAATGFGETEWFSTLRNALYMEELVRQHAAIMDRHDPERRVALVVDEWATWYDANPDAPQGFFYCQQNTLRDALAAGLTLNIFNNHAHRVRMANIAQTANVLQSMVLTRGPEMLMTATYHVFEMYRVHQGATLLPTRLLCDDYTHADQRIPVLSASASRDSAGRVHISLCNVHPSAEARVRCELEGVGVTAASARVLTAPGLDTRNTFEEPSTLMPRGFTDFRLARTTLEVALPSKSVVVFEIA